MSSAAGSIAIIIGCIIGLPVTVAILYHCYDLVVRILKSAAASQNNNGVWLPEIAVVADSQVEGATMERFLSNIARERPLRFSPQQLAAFTKGFSKVLGSGGFGVVYKGEFPNGVQLAVKVLNYNTSNRVAEQFMAEVGTIGRTYHINLVRLYGFCFHNTMRALVYEYMELGSLDKLLFTELNRSINWEKLQDIAIGTAKGIAYLHEECQQRIIHYDIKPENVLLDTNLTPKVADFGLATLCNQDNTHVSISGYRGTPGYAAPEMWTPYPVTHKCDVYSYGMLLFEIIGRRRNFDAKLSSDNSQEWLPRWTYNKFKEGGLLEMFNTCGVLEENSERAERMVKVALWCVQYLPKARPMMSAVVKMLEGGIEIDTPPNPFEHLKDLALELRSNCCSNASTTMASSHPSLPPLVEWNHSVEPTRGKMLGSLEILEMGANTV